MLLKERKSKSLDDEPRKRMESGSPDSALTAMSYIHHRASSIPKPSGTAPLFRNDTLDRFHSRIPYPKTKGKKGNIYYDVLTGRESQREANQMDSGTKWDSPFLSEVDHEAWEKGKKNLASASPGGVNPAMSDSQSPASDKPFKLDSQQPHHTPKSSNISRSSTLKPNNGSSSRSPSTVVEYGTDMTDLMEDWGAQTYFHRPSLHDSDSSSVMSLDNPQNQTGIPHTVSLPPSFLKDCTEGKNREWQFDISRVPSAMEVQSDDAWQTRKGVSPSSTTSSHRTMFYKLGRFRRCPQRPVSESSDDDSGDDFSFMSLSSAKSKNEYFSNSVPAFARNESAEPQSERSWDSLDDFSVCAMKSDGRSQSYDSNMHSNVHSDEHKHNWSVEFSPSEKSSSGKQPSPREPRRRMPKWLGITLEISVKALMVFSGAAIASALLDSNKSHKNTPPITEVMDAYDLDDDELFNCTLVPSGPMTQSYPISLLDSLSDSDIA